jgi:hypothetical protein
LILRKEFERFQQQGVGHRIGNARPAQGRRQTIMVKGGFSHPVPRIHQHIFP